MNTIEIRYVVKRFAMFQTFIMKYRLVIIGLSFFVKSSFCQTQLELNQNSYNEYKKADSLLNARYKELTSKLGNSDSKKILVKAQRAWISYRDAHCSYTESFYEGGSIQPIIYTVCLLQLTNNRIKELEEAIEELDK